MKVKICGLRSPKNIESLLDLPVDFLGFIFYRKSPRYAGDAKDLEPWIESQGSRLAGKSLVGVFVNAELEEVLNKVHDYQLHYVQLHGVESPEYCRELLTFWEASSLRSARLIKTFSVDENFDFQATEAYVGLCDYFLFDTRTPAHGGSGETFNWSLLDQYQGPTPFLLAGGIGPESLADIRRLRHPRLLGIDLNSRFETQPGVKDVDRIRQFLQELNDILED